MWPTRKRKALFSVLNDRVVCFLYAVYDLCVRVCVNTMIEPNMCSVHGHIASGTRICTLTRERQAMAIITIIDKYLKVIHAQSAQHIWCEWDKCGKIDRKKNEQPIISYRHVSQFMYWYLLVKYEFLYIDQGNRRVPSLYKINSKKQNKIKEKIDWKKQPIQCCVY